MTDYVVTGSRAYGVVAQSSDLDIVLDSRDSLELRSELQSKGIVVTTTPEQETYIGGWYYFTLGVVKINIINSWSSDEMEAWRYATEKMKAEKSISDKLWRNERFQEHFWNSMNKETT